MFTELYNKYIYPLCVRIFFFGCHTYTVSNEAWQGLLDSNENLRILVTETKYTIHTIHSFITGRRIEPRDLPWIHTYGLLSNATSLTQIYSLEEKTHTFFRDYFFIDLFESDAETDYAKKYVSMIGKRIPSEQLSPLVIIKGSIAEKTDMYLVRRGPFHIENPITNFSREPSKVRFVSIEYLHPELEEAIEIKLDDNWFIVGNELFTPAFVLRTLEYQSKCFFFDKEYKVRVMDSEYSVIEFNADSYIVLEKDTYVLNQNEVFSEGESTYDGDSDTDSCNEKTI
jgi:hypothetical protein